MTNAWNERNGSYIETIDAKSAATSRDRRFSVLLALLGFTTTLGAFWPGIMVYDSQQQFQQAVLGTYSTCHPIIMALLWRLLNHVHMGPQPMLVLYAAGYWGALLLASEACRRMAVRHAVCLVLIGYLPPVWTFSGVIVKDTMNVAAFGLACSLLLLAGTLTGKGPRRILCVVAALLLTVGTMARLNAISALPPLAFWVGWLWLQADKRSWWRVSLLAAAFTAVAAAAIPLLNRAVAAYPMPQSTTVMVYDIAGISVRSGTDFFPEYIRSRPSHSMADVAEAYPKGSEVLFQIHPLRIVNDEIPYLRIGYQGYLTIDAPDHEPEVRQAWQTAIRAHPLTYLRHRLSVWAGYLRFGYRSGHGIMYFNHGGPLSDMGIFSLRSKAQEDRIIWPVGLCHMAVMTLFKPYFWLAVSLAILAFVLPKVPRDQHSVALGSLCLSSVLCSLGYLPAAPTFDYRFAYWPVMASMLSTGIALLCWASTRDRNLGAGLILACVAVLGTVATEYVFRMLGPRAAVLIAAAGAAVLVLLWVRIRQSKVQASVADRLGSSS